MVTGKKANALKVAGVPEAYNEPFSRARFSGLGRELPVFCSHPGGSGSMLKALVANEVDAAFALTDCIVAAIENDSPVRILGPLVTSPLTWAIVVAPNGVESVTDLRDATWGVSRLGSGSHVMAQVLAKGRKWATPKFEICGNFDGLRSALREGRIDVFLWEHFTTKPFTESENIRIIGGVPTPWGCFSVAVRSDCNKVEEIRAIVDAFLVAGKEFLQDEGSVEAIRRNYRMMATDAKAWMQGVRYADPGKKEVAMEMLETTRNTLYDAGVIETLLCKDGVQGYHI